MKQVIQNYKTGELKVQEVPMPVIKKSNIIVKTRASLISAGTERTKIETAQMNLIEKAISRLDLVKILVNNIKQEGIVFTFKKAFNKLNSPISMGYSCSGEVIEAGDEATGFKTGDKVACVGENFATHSEVNDVPSDFAVKIPGGIDFQEASFVGLGAIALNSVEISQAEANEKVVVIGLGLLGQIVTQILKAKGCKVCGIEIDKDKLELARELGIDVGGNPITDDIYAQISDFTSGKGTDCVIITAASKNNMPIEMAGKISGNKGRVILVGAMPITIPRNDFYEKELIFMISRGFGAGLYHSIEKGRKFTFNYKQITFQQNMINFLNMVKDGKVNIKRLITHRFSIDDAVKAYDLIKTGKEKYLGIIFDYTKEPVKEKIVAVEKKAANKPVSIGFIGAGSFAQGYILPILRKSKDANLVGVSTASGMESKSVADKFGFSYATTNSDKVISDESIDSIFVVTRHNLHGKFVLDALKRHKNVHVEKPLCVNEKELKEIIDVYSNLNNKPIINVGFNRRFSPFIIKTKQFFRNRTSPLVMNYRVNAGFLPASHWVHSDEGGGRIIGEICHFVDLFQFLAGSKPAEVTAMALDHSDKSIAGGNVLINIRFINGSIGTINYNSLGDSSFSRERLEAFADGSVAVVDNYNIGTFTRNGIQKKLIKIGRDMGHNNEVTNLVQAFKLKNSGLIPFDELVATTLATFKIKEALEKKCTVKIDYSKYIK